MKRFSLSMTGARAHSRRRGAIFVLAALAMVLIFGFTAFTVDVGFLAMTKGQLQNTADAGALAGLIEMAEGYGPGSTMTDAEIVTAASNAAVTTVSSNRAGDLNSVYASAARDVRLGKYSYDAGTGTWVKTWGVAPYNMIEVTLHRDQGGSSLGDGPLDLFFAPVMGTDTATLSVKSTAVLQPGVGIRSNGSNFIGVLPITLDLPTWDALINDGVGTDEYTYDEATGTVTPGPDGILEVNLYPNSAVGMAGNRGTVDIGGSGNSTADITRQILHGLSSQDLEPFGGELSFEQGSIILNGDTGLSAGIKDDLTAIKGDSRAIPIFVDAWGNGNNAYYEIVKFVGIRIMEVNLTGKPADKRVIIQPAPWVSDVVIPGDVEVTEDSIFTSGSLINN